MVILRGEGKSLPWKFDYLPVIPRTFELEPIKQSEDRLKKVLQLAKSKDVTEIVNACDAGREGELIFHNLVRYGKWTKPARRLWMQSMTDEAILNAWHSMRSEADMQPLTNAAVCRSESDWLVGLNSTRALTILQSRGGFNVTPAGRVLRLDDTILTRSGIPSILPEKLRISCIYLQIIPPATGGEELHLTIRDSNGALVDRSVNSVPSFTVPGQSTSTFFFPALPELSTDRAYTYAFETAAHKAVPMQMACFKSETERTEEAFPKIRFIIAPAAPEPALMHDPAYKGLVAAVTTPSPGHGNVLGLANATPDMLAALEQLSKAGYPVAQQVLGKLLMSPDCPGGPRPEEGVEWLYRSATGGCYEAMKELGILLMDIPSYFPRLPQQPPLASRDYAQAARFLRMAVQYRDQEALYLLSLMYSQGWGVPASPELSGLMMERLNGSAYLTDSLNPEAPIAAYWLPLPLARGESTILRFTVPGPFAPSQLKGVTLHNTGMKDAFSISKINILQHGRLILDIISPQEVLPGKSSAPIGISIPEGLLADTSLPLEVEILLTPGNSSGVVEMPPPAEKKRSRNGTD